MANSEVQDLMDNTLSCQNLAPFAKMTKYATGGLVDGVPLICGGEYSDYYDAVSYTHLTLPTIYSV